MKDTVKKKDTASAGDNGNGNDNVRDQRSMKVGDLIKEEYLHWLI